MGGSSSPASSGAASPVIVKPDASYFPSLLSGLKISSNLPGQIAASAPELRTVDVRALQDMAKKEALINALSSKEIEARVSPDTAAIREELPAQIRMNLEGGPDQKLSNLWLRSGLSDVLATGARDDSGFARSALVDSTRRDYYDEQTKQQAKAAGWLSSNPAPVAGIDPGNLAASVQTANNANADARDYWRQAVLSSGQQGNQNLMSALQQNEQLWGNYKNNLATVTNSARASGKSFWGNALSGAATGAMAGTTISPGWGTLIGGVVGGAAGALA